MLNMQHRRPLEEVTWCYCHRLPLTFIHEVQGVDVAGGCTKYASGNAQSYSGTRETCAVARCSGIFRTCKV